VPNLGGVWSSDADRDRAAARAEIPGLGCEEAAGPARGLVLLPESDPAGTASPGTGIWQTGGEPTCDGIGEAANRAVEAALGALLAEPLLLCEWGEDAIGTGRGREEDGASRGVDMISFAMYKDHRAAEEQKHKDIAGLIASCQSPAVSWLRKKDGGAWDVQVRLEDANIARPELSSLISSVTMEAEEKASVSPGKRGRVRREDPAGSAAAAVIGTVLIVILWLGRPVL
jgi:hypothetical protein